MIWKILFNKYITKLINLKNNMNKLSNKWKIKLLLQKNKELLLMYKINNSKNKSKKAVNNHHLLLQIKIKNNNNNFKVKFKNWKKKCFS